MTATVRIQRKGQITIPIRLRVQVGLDDGDLVEARAERGKIVLTPKPLVDRTAGGEYTLSQRRALDARLAESLEQARKGETYGPFETHQELTAFLHRQAKETRSKKSKSAKALADFTARQRGFRGVAHVSWR
jgi:AbrB family looped-hinge helix DNA binding protein